MRTNFSESALRRPKVAEMDAILRKCVHCGFCLTACPTYVETGDERDSPRGRIYLIKDMLESGTRPALDTAVHVDQCLGCLACKTACPSGVDYETFIDIGRAHLETVLDRPSGDRILRWLLSLVLPHARRARFFFILGRLGRPFLSVLGGRLAGMAARIPTTGGGKILDQARTFPAVDRTRLRVVLAPGCVQQVLRPSINDASIRLLNRLGADVMTVGDGAGCCGALDHHVSREAEAQQFARTNLAAWTRRFGEQPFDYIVTNAAGCGTQIRAYKRILADGAGVRDMVARVRDITEVLAELGLPAPSEKDLPPVIYHDACSLMHGQGITSAPRKLLAEAGFALHEIPGKHFCCGSAGSYNLLQPDMAGKLLNRRLCAISKAVAGIGTRAVIATGNIGCIEQLATSSEIPVLHTAELLDWATGGPPPPEIADGP